MVYSPPNDKPGVAPVKPAVVLAGIATGEEILKPCEHSNQLMSKQIAMVSFKRSGKKVTYLTIMGGCEFDSQRCYIYCSFEMLCLKIL